MTPKNPDEGRDAPDESGFGSVADELKRQSEKLRLLAEELKAREEALAEMLANYPHLKHAVYALLREKFDRELEPLPDKDLETIARDEGALPLEAFIADLQ